MFDIAQMERGNRVEIDRTRDRLLSDSAKALLVEKFLMPEERYQDLFARIAVYYGDDNDHAQRLYDYMSKLWFMPSTSVLANGGTSRGLPISCFLNETQDSLEDIVSLWNENIWLTSMGGAVGSYWGNVRSIGEDIGRHGKANGVVPMMRVMDSMSMAISSGNQRQGTAAIYLPVWHPEIEEFIDIRRQSGVDPSRKISNLHHGVLVDHHFMKAVENEENYALKSPHDGAVLDSVPAHEIWTKLLAARIETGEPYIIYIDNVNDKIPDHHKMAGLNVKMSNLCSEITLPTGVDHLGSERTAVCCLSSLNLEMFEQWQDHSTFVQDVMRFLDNVLNDFIKKAPDTLRRAKYSAMRERSVGLGVMGFHGFLQSKMLPIDSVMAKVWNRKIFQHIKQSADSASVCLAEERGACPDALDYGVMERFSNKIAIAPTSVISSICGNTSSGIEPFAKSVSDHVSLSGSYSVRNTHLEKLLDQKDHNTDDIWDSIDDHDGSVQHLDCLSQEEKDVFKTAFEIDQRWLIEHAGDRTPYVCQAQSLNMYISSSLDQAALHSLHWDAWKKGVKSLYYCKAETGVRLQGFDYDKAQKENPKPLQYDECLACQ
ncbi:MAG: ribonucleoside-diphosphate reductase subunit alpha [Bdellovibrionales bacterium]